VPRLGSPLPPRVDLALFLWLHAPGLSIGGGPPYDGVYIERAGASVKVDLQPLGHGIHSVEQRGPYRLWDTIEHALASWEALEHPDAARFGVTALNTTDIQYVWLDEPNGAHIWPLVHPVA
jgi:hypothetical protein